MADFIVLKNHDIKKKVAIEGERVSYSEKLGRELVKKGFLTPVKTAVLEKPSPVLTEDQKELLHKIPTKRSRAQLQEIVDSKQHPSLVEAAEKRLEQLG